METIGRLAGNIAHDFNNLLGAIMMATDFLLNAHKPTDPSFQDIMQIKQNANRAASLVRQLLAFSRKQTMRPQVLDLGEALSDLTMLLKRLIGENVTLDVPQVRDLWPVKADVRQFEQVIINLAVNARDAMPLGGKLTLRTAMSAPRTANVTRACRSGIRAGRGGGHRQHRARDHRQDLRPLLHHQGHRQGHRARALDRLRHRQADRRLHLCGVGARQGHDFRIFLPRHIPAADDVHLPQLPETTAPPSPARCPPPTRCATAADLTGRGTVLLVEDEEELRALNARGLDRAAIP